MLELLLGLILAGAAGPGAAAERPADPAAAAAPAAEASPKPKAPRPRLSAQGRVLYSNDDDWDWASPAGKQTSRLHTYGEMSWSALDWIEEGLPEVRGLVVGTLCTDYLNGTLDAARGRPDKETYRAVAPRAGVFAERLAADGKDAPNVVLIMRNCHDDFAPDLGANDLEALAGFAERGGRLIVLDDWGVYRPVLTRLLAARPAGEAKPPAPPDGALEAKVQAAVRRLGDDNWEVREQASRDLVAMGAEILPILEKTASDDLETRTRLEAAIAAIARRPAAGKDGHVESLTNEEMDALLPGAAKAWPSAKMKDTTRNGDKQPGRALLLESPGDGKRAPKPPDGKLPGPGPADARRP